MKPGMWRSYARLAEWIHDVMKCLPDPIHKRTCHSRQLRLFVQVLQHLDEEGNARVCSLLRGMYQDTVLIVGQADSYVAHAFDAVDIVVKQNGCSQLQVAA